jgi:cholesterol transport system auxiliary component
MALIGAVCSFSGCSAITSLNTAAKPLDTYDLRPVAGARAGGRKSRTLLVAQPQAPAALATDRILIKPDPASITYLPGARWSDELPAVVQSLLIRSISQTGRIAYVGRTDAGPIPDKALLVRIDAFDVSVLEDGTFEVQVGLDLTIINDRDQRVVATRLFSQYNEVLSDDPKMIVAAFQAVLNDILPSMSDWAVQKV